MRHESGSNSATRRESVTLASRQSLPIRVELRWPGAGRARAAVIVCHGFKGFKSWGFFPYLAERLATAGFAAVTFDFSMNGIADRSTEFTRLDLFRKNCYSREIEDLEDVLRWLQTESSVADSLAPKSLGLLGHSRGAVPVLTVARETPAVAAVVTWSGVGRVLRYSQRQLERWRQEGSMEFKNTRTGQVMAVDYTFVEDARAHAERFDLQRAAREMAAAHLIVHGRADLAVDLEEAEFLRAGRTERCEVHVVEGASHTFNATHPFHDTTPELEEALGRTLEWYRAHLH